MNKQLPYLIFNVVIAIGFSVIAILLAFPVLTFFAGIFIGLLPFNIVVALQNKVDESRDELALEYGVVYIKGKRYRGTLTESPIEN